MGPTVPGADVSPVLIAEGLSKQFNRRPNRGSGRKRKVPGAIRAVDDVSLSLWPGRVVAVVGESGSGKSTLVKMLARLERPSRGSVRVAGIGRGGNRAYRRRVQVVFQDPFSSLNPMHDVEYHLKRPFLVHRIASRGVDLDRAVTDLLEKVSLRPAAQFLRKRPHELSGGQRQRVAIARALAVAPQVLLADEPVSMLDVSIRLEILNLLDDLRAKEDLAVLYVTHDIASARYFADLIIVMYAGRVVETGPSIQVTDHPAHPYTRMLLSAAADPDNPGRRSWRPTNPNLDGDVAAGCRFRARCPHAMASCCKEPLSREVSQGHDVACWLYPQTLPAALQNDDRGDDVIGGR